MLRLTVEDQELPVALSADQHAIVAASNPTIRLRSKRRSHIRWPELARIAGHTGLIEQTLTGHHNSLFAKLDVHARTELMKKTASDATVRFVRTHFLFARHRMWV